MNDIEYLRREKQMRGLSYELMARELGVSMRTLYRWLIGENKPSLMGREKIAAYAANNESK
jgi:transcriptional regulator with XRE-family HTH domain